MCICWCTFIYALLAWDNCPVQWKGCASSIVPLHLRPVSSWYATVHTLPHGFLLGGVTRKFSVGCYTQGDGRGAAWLSLPWLTVCMHKAATLVTMANSVDIALPWTEHGVRA